MYLIEIIKLNNILLFLQLLTTFFETFRILRTFSRRFCVANRRRLCDAIETSRRPLPLSFVKVCHRQKHFSSREGEIFCWIYSKYLNASPDVHRPKKQLIMLEVGPSVHFIFIFNRLLLSILLNLILYLQLTFLSARVKTDTSTIEKRRTNIFIVTKNTNKL